MERLVQTQSQIEWKVADQKEIVWEVAPEKPLSAWNDEHELRRLSEKGLSYEDKISSLQDQYWSLVAERTGAPNNFTLEAEFATKKVTATGFAHRGDLDNSYEKSVSEAPAEAIAKRFDLENTGYEAAKRYFFDAPLYSTVLLVYPAPSVDMRAYGYGTGEGSSMCFYHILPGETPNKRTIKSLTWLNKFDKNDAADILNTISKSKKVQPTEESIALNPIAENGLTHDTASLHTIWNEIEKQHKKRNHDFILPPFRLIEEYLLHGEEIKRGKYSALSMMIDELARKFEEGKLDDNFQRKWQIMLNLADQQLLHQDISEMKTQPKDIFICSKSQTIFEAFQHLDYKPRVAATSCGTSGSEMDSLFKNPLKELSSSTLLTTNTFEVEKGPCEECGGSSSDNHYHCPGCKKSYSDETHKVHRTEKCDCGFKFGC